MTYQTSNEEIDNILLKFASSEMDEMGIQQGAISENMQLFTLDEAHQAIATLLVKARIDELETLMYTFNPKRVLSENAQDVVKNRITKLTNQQEGDK